MIKHIYLDNAATTRLDSKVLAAMKPFFTETYGNASSVHTFGQEARRAVEGAREEIAKFLNCDSMEVVFTSGGSESDNLAIRGVVENYLKTNKDVPHVVTSELEHHAVLHTVQALEKEGKISVTYLKPDQFGIVTPTQVKNSLKKNTILVSIMYVNNEIGTVLPIAEIGKMLEGENANRELKIIFHTDAVQATEFFDMNVQELKVDLLTLTAHKIHGPKGVGALFIRKGVRLLPMITGGEQEFRKRAGTENVPGIVGFAMAVKQVKSSKSKIEGMRKLRDKLEHYLLSNVSDTFLNGHPKKRSPAILNISFKNAEGEAIILNLDFLGIAVSSGSACTAMSLDPSHVLTAIGVPRELSHGAIRFSLSRETTEGEIDQLTSELPGIIEKLRMMSPLLTEDIKVTK